ncbi:MAG: hypothetical protein JWN94_1981 [Betaproteobacteria bacterium]|nr:hypothetical protein [Betaproteobacteria bacterium]
MKRSLISLAVALLSGSAFAASDYVDTAQVISSKPIIERVSESRQECSPAAAPQKSGSNVIAPILGGVVGGLLGHQVGGGSGQTVATIVGATGGAVAGSAIGNRSSTQQGEQQCRTVESSREVVNGYDVVYRYNGRDVSVALPYNPGSTIKVGVSAIPDDRSADARRDDRDVRPDSYDNRPDNRSRRRTQY